MFAKAHQVILPSFGKHILRKWRVKV